MSLDSLEKQEETLTTSNHILKLSNINDPKRKCFEKFQQYFNGISNFLRFRPPPEKNRKNGETDHND